MTIQGAMQELINLLNADDIPIYYKGGIQKVIETIDDYIDGKDDYVKCRAEQTEPQTIRCPKCGRSDYIREFGKDFSVTAEEAGFKYKCINCNTYIEPQSDHKTEPTISKMEQVEPQTEPLPKTINGVRIADAVAWADKWLEDNSVSEMWDMIRTLRDATEWQDEPQTGEIMTEEEFDSMLARVLTGNAEPQTETEIAKAIVHKAIDDAVIAEDTYPNLRQKMHDAVDEYEPQTERSE